MALALAISKQMELVKVNTNNLINRNKRSNTMRRYIYLFAMLTLFVIGCSEQSNMLTPVNNVNTTEPNWIALPQAEGLSVNKEFSTSKWINSYYGGTLSEYESYYGGPFGRVTIDVDAYFPSYSFYGSKNITMIVDDQTCTATFSPHMVFNRSVVYNAVFTGVDLTGIDPSKVKFAYLAEDGSLEYAANEGITVDKSRGKLVVKNAKIPHFSRYGFVN
jgi:hypothetical protein